MLRKNLVFTIESPFKLIHGLALKDCRSLTAGSTKPPNILVVTERHDSISQWRELLQRVLLQETYAIYKFGGQDFYKGHWKSYTSLLILDQIKRLDYGQKMSVESYLQQGGKIFSHCSLYPYRGEKETSWNRTMYGDLIPTSCSFMSHQERVQFTAMVEGHLEAENCMFSNNICNTSNKDEQVLMSEEYSDGKVIISALDFITTLSNLQAESQNCDDVEKLFSLLTIVMRDFGLQCTNENRGYTMQPTIGFLMGDREMASQFRCNVKRRQENLPQSLKYLNIIEEDQFTQHGPISEEKFTVILPEHFIAAGGKQDIKFNFSTYWKYLKSQRLGRLLIYTDVISSTQNVLNRICHILPESNGFMVVAGQQTNGKGRAGNIWLSPYGCMMFSIAVCIPAASTLGCKIPFLQHIAAVALVMAVKEQPGYENISIGIKWPNDIYIGDNIKIGGLIVNSSYSNGVFNAIIGVGMNLSNKKPTICLNSVIEEYNLLHHTTLKYFTVELLLAKTITNIEMLIDRFECRGVEDFCKMYYNYWLHSNQRVKMYDDDEIVTVRGLDRSGFLLVENKDGDLLSLQSDGNSFDMMQGLIRIKTSN